VASNPRRDTFPYALVPPILTGEQIAQAMERALAIRCRRGLNPAVVAAQPMDACDAIERTEHDRLQSWSSRMRRSSGDPQTRGGSLGGCRFNRTGSTIPTQSDSTSRIGGSICAWTCAIE
jgi:hypothetical protein